MAGVVVGTLFGLSLLIPTLKADDDDVRHVLPATWNWTQDTQGPVCGVYAVCRALNLLEIAAHPEEMWNTKVVAHREGSSPLELIEAIEQYGGVGELRDSMSILELFAVARPVIANVRSNTARSLYDHWVCVCGTSDGLVVYDGSKPARRISPGEFLASFSGIGIVVDAGLDSRNRCMAARWIGFLIIVATAWLGLRWWAVEASASIARQFIRLLIVTVAVVLMAAWVFSTHEGLKQGYRIALAPYSTSDRVMQGGMATLEQASSSEDYLLVDARTAESFARGSLPRAVNIPVYASYYETREFTASLARTTPIVVFCESERCTYDDHVAHLLVQLGFQNVTVSLPGYREYVQSQLRLNAAVIE